MDEFEVIKQARSDGSYIATPMVDVTDNAEFEVIKQKRSDGKCIATPVWLVGGGSSGGDTITSFANTRVGMDNELKITTDLGEFTANVMSGDTITNVTSQINSLNSEDLDVTITTDSGTFTNTLVGVLKDLNTVNTLDVVNSVLSGTNLKVKMTDGVEVNYDLSTILTNYYNKTEIDDFFGAVYFESEQQYNLITALQTEQTTQNTSISNLQLLSHDPATQQNYKLSLDSGEAISSFFYPTLDDFNSVKNVLQTVAYSTNASTINANPNVFGSSSVGLKIQRNAADGTTLKDFGILNLDVLNGELSALTRAVNGVEIEANIPRTQMLHLSFGNIASVANNGTFYPIAQTLTSTDLQYGNLTYAFSGTGNNRLIRLPARTFLVRYVIIVNVFTTNTGSSSSGDDVLIVRLWNADSIIRVKSIPQADLKGGRGTIEFFTYTSGTEDPMTRLNGGFRIECQNTTTDTMTNTTTQIRVERG